ncbi:MAG: acyltransferase family protein [Stappiaceae bacterium]
MNAVKSRIDWVDYAKGFCIIFVVMMHSTLGVEKAAGEEGWMHALVAFAQPFRMPDFFMISGLFLARVIDRNWRPYLDKKVVHFAYFYVLWVTIQFATKAPGFAAEMGWSGVVEQYFLAYIEPFGTLWFIYLLPLFFVVTKLTRQAGVPWQVVLAVAAVLQILPIHTGWLIIDESASRFVFFFAGYQFAPVIFRLADWVQDNVLLAVAGLCAWAVFNGTLVYIGWSMLPIISLGLGALGAVAVINISALLAKIHWFSILRYCGQNSIVIYLSFFLPMAASRIVLLKLGVITDIGTISMFVTAAGVVGPLFLLAFINWTGWGRLLFTRPQWAQLKDRSAPASIKMEPAE